MSIDIETLRAVRRIITHDSCPDGIAAAMILHDALPDATIEFVQYGQPSREQLEATEHMLFCDMAPPRERVQEFVDVGAIVLDHHEKQRDIVEAFGERGVFGENAKLEAGAWLAFWHVWDRLTAPPATPAVGSFAEFAAIRDTWANNLRGWEHACEQAEALMFYGAEYFLGKDGRYTNARRHEVDHEPYLRSDEMVVGKRLFAKKLKTARDIAEHHCLPLGSVRLFPCTGRQTSDVAEALREVDPECEIACGFFHTVVDGAMSIVYSLRSCADDVDVGAIAKANGGGGHRAAAGFTVALAEGRNSQNPIELLKTALAGSVL